MSRKKLHTILGLLLLAGLVYWLYPFVMGQQNMKSFCSGLPMGASQQCVEEAVSNERFRLAVGKDQSGFVHDPRAFGRFICEVKFTDGRMASAEYFLND